MILSETERCILSNQYRILAALYPNDADHFALAQEVLDSGYEYLYDEFSQHIYRETFSSERSDEVISILEMFTVVEGSYNNLDDKDGVDPFYAKFSGFDGNNETEERSFARFFCNKMDRFNGIEVDVNSHAQHLPMYRRMLARFKELRPLFPERFLTKEQLIEITAAGPYPK
jgi:uncharacterized protein YfbU (UPF0304 family)